MNRSVVLLTNTIHSCRIPVLNHFGKINPNFKVIYLGEKHNDRGCDVNTDKICYKFEVLKGLNYFYRKLDWSIHISSGLIRKLIKDNFDVIVCEGYDLPGYFLALAYSKMFTKKLVLWSGSTLKSGRTKNKVIDWLKRSFVKNSDAYLAYGSMAKEQLVYYGAEDSRIVVGCNTVDVNFFKSKVLEFSRQREKVKTERQYPKYLILFCGQLIERKGVLVLLKAFQDLASEDAGLVILGDGRKRKEYEDRVKSQGIKNVFFGGYQSQEDLCMYYVLSDLFVLPSFVEVWGLVVNEAMACGLPILCSSMVGASKDLVKDGINGYVFSPYDPNDLRDKIAALLSDDTLRKQMGEQSKRIISAFTPEKYAEDLHEAIELAFEG